jgi:hypothetical protein
MLLKAKLATCITLAGIAETKRQIGDDEGGELATLHAEEVYLTLERLLSGPKHVKHITDEEQRELMVEMGRLRKKLDGFTVSRQERRA